MRLQLHIPVPNQVKKFSSIKWITLTFFVSKIKLNINSVFSYLVIHLLSFFTGDLFFLASKKMNRTKRIIAATPKTIPAMKVYPLSESISYASLARSNLSLLQLIGQSTQPQDSLVP